jgi:hypothetical protein
VTEEQKRLEEARRRVKDWKLWGPYLSERAWGTVREDYSADGSAWEFFPHDHARSRVFRWNEDGLLGICDRRQQICFALALWNGEDPILKERMFGLTNNQGNHGEDVKEYYYFLDSTPTHSYMKALYKYPQAAFPYQQLVNENGRRGKHEPEYELYDTGVFRENRYFDVFIEYAKADPDDLLIQISIVNRGPDAAPITVLPTLWFRNNWSWYANHARPSITAQKDDDTPALVAVHSEIGTRYLNCFSGGEGGEPELLFTENESNFEKLYPLDGKNVTSTVKDGINDYIVNGAKSAVHPDRTGTKAAAAYRLTLSPGQTQMIRLRFAGRKCDAADFGADFDNVFGLRRSEADAFYATLINASASSDEKAIQRQAFAGMLWSKQFYHFNVRKWLEGDPTQPTPPASRRDGRNSRWDHVDSADVISMPDTWEYPWFAAWDLAFHCVTLSLVDPYFAKEQLILLQREWYMHPNGQLPAYEWAFGDVNPPVQAWAAMRVYQIDRRLTGKGDVSFLQRVFHKLLLNFTWWVNQKDTEGRNVFQGGFLGLDNIGVFDRSAPLPTGGFINQSDGTAWMAMYCLNMFAIAIELAGHDVAYQDVAVKFLEHYFYIANAMNDRPAARGDDGLDLWDNQDCFYYDVLHLADNTHFPLRVRSMVGLLPLLASQTIEQDVLERVPELRRRIDWFIANRPDLCSDVASITQEGAESRRLFSVVNKERLQQMLRRMLDPNEFLSPYGLRALSRFHLNNPYSLTVHGVTYEVKYDPAESTTGAFGGNSNWRGPIWFPPNYLLIEALQRLDFYYGDEFKVECPVGSGKMMTLWDVSLELSRRLTSIFLKDGEGRRPVFGSNEMFQKDPNFRDYLPFAEYFHGDTGAGLGATHQTGWTGLIAKIIQQNAEYSTRPVDRSAI